MTQPTLEIGDFELAMERSFIYHMRNAVPSITVGGETVLCQWEARFPYEQFEDPRRRGCVVTVEILQIKQEGWKIGTEIEQPMSSTNTTPDYYIPFRYVLEFSLGAFTSSPQDRAKLDGAIMNAIQRVQHTGIPVYSFISETIPVTSQDTGSRITIPSMNMVSRIRSEDEENHDYLSNWTIDARCLYVYSTTTQVVTTVSVSSTITNPQTGEVFPTPTPTYLPPVQTNAITAVTDPNVPVNIPWSNFFTDPQALPLSVGSFDSVSALSGGVTLFSPSLIQYAPPTDVESTVDTFDIVVTNGYETVTSTISVTIRSF